jgi:large subunit ribosomal protein L14
LIQQESMLEIADNSGVKTGSVHQGAGEVQCRNVGKRARPTATVGDVVCMAIKKHMPNCQLDHKKVHKCVIVRTRKAVRRPMAAMFGLTATPR